MNNLRNTQRENYILKEFEAKKHVYTEGKLHTCKK